MILLKDKKKNEKKAQESKKVIPEDKHIDRNCLKCGYKFVAPNRYIRLCPNCKKRVGVMMI